MLLLGSLSSLRAATAAFRGGGAPSAARCSSSAVGGSGEGGGKGDSGFGSGFGSALGFGRFRSLASGLDLAAAASPSSDGSLPPLPRLAAGLGAASVLGLLAPPPPLLAPPRARFLRFCAS